MFPGTREVLAKYQSAAQARASDPLGPAFPPLGYAAAKCWPRPVEGTKSLDQITLGRLYA